jgi:hypothetical protein
MVEEETLMSALKTIFEATRRLLQQWRVMALLAGVYASLLATLFLFVATKEATRWQVMLTLVFAALAPVLFFLLQAMIVNYAHGEIKAATLLRRSFRDSCRLALSSLPLALLIVFFIYLLNKSHSFSVIQFPLPRFTHETWPAVQPSSSVSQTAAPSWSQLALSTLRLLVFAIILPLGAIHLWSAAAREGFFAALKKLPRNLLRAFAPQSALVYSLGFILFGLIPYFLLFTHIPASDPWVAFSFFVARLLLAFVFTLYGWVLTMSALAVAGNAKGVDTI